MSNGVTHSIVLLHGCTPPSPAPVVLGCFYGRPVPVMGALSPVKERGCLYGRPVPREGNMAASMGALSPVKGTWLPLWAPCPREGNVAASMGALSPVKGTWLPLEVVMSISHRSWLLALTPTSMEKN